MANMAARLGNVLFWASIILAALSVIVSQDKQVGAGVGAALILIGWACRYVLSAAKSKPPG